MPNITEEDLNLFRHDAYQRFKLGSTPLSKPDVARAKYQFDDLTRKFIQFFENNENLFDQCVSVLLPKTKQNFEYREKLNLVLVAIRELLVLEYIPIINQKSINLGTATINNYYETFIIPLNDEDKLAKLKEFTIIFTKIYELKQILVQIDNNLQNNILLYKSVYWMLSLLYKAHSNALYDFDTIRFSRYLQKDAEIYFDNYKSNTSSHIEARYSYIYNYLCEDLEQNIIESIRSIKDNKNLLHYKMINKNDNAIWNIVGSDRQVVPSPGTMSVSEIIKLIKENHLIVQPDFQRAEVCSITKSSRIIESILLGVKLPPIYLYAYREEDRIQKYIVLDRTAEIN